MATLPPPDALSTPNINIALQARTTLPEEGKPFFFQKVGAVSGGFRAYACVQDMERLYSHSTPPEKFKKQPYFVSWGIDDKIDDDGTGWRETRTLLTQGLVTSLNLVPGIMDDPTKLMNLVDQLSEIDVKFFRSGVDFQGKKQVLEAIKAMGTVQISPLLQQYKAEYEAALKPFQNPPATKDA